MRRTNIYLEEDKLEVLKHLAIAEGTSSAELVRQAVDAFLNARLSQRQQWGRRLESLVQRVREQLPADLSPADIEADITAASAEVEAVRLARGR